MVPGSTGRRKINFTLSKVRNLSVGACEKTGEINSPYAHSDKEKSQGTPPYRINRKMKLRKKGKGARTYNTRPLRLLDQIRGPKAGERVVWAKPSFAARGKTFLAAVHQRTKPT